MDAASILNPIVSALAGLGGVWLGGSLSDRREREKRHVDFITRQLSEFYGPLVSMRNEIQARDSLDKEIVTTDGRWSGDEDSQFKERQITDFRTKTIPSYLQMVATFREKMWLAESQTRLHFQNLSRFVDLMVRGSTGAISGEVYLKLKSDEELQIFYNHIEETCDRLRQKLDEKTAMLCSMFTYKHEFCRRINRCMEIFRKN